jgi:ABC-type transport system substrate-binding protein
MGEYFQKQMEQIGVKIKIITSPWPEFQAKVKKKSVEVYGLAWSADYPDAENFLQLFYGPNKSPGANGSNYDDPKFNKEFEAAVVPVASACWAGEWQALPYPCRRKG